MNSTFRKYFLLLPALFFTVGFLTFSCTHGPKDVSLNSFSPQSKADSLANAFGHLLPGTPPEELYHLYNQFCLTHFGAGADPLVCQTFGNNLRETPGSRWSYTSEQSAAMAWSTNLPAKGFIEYGTSASYDHKTMLPERFFYTHIHYLKNLRRNTTYHYRLVSVDEKGRQLVSDDQTFQTRDIPEAVHIPGDMGKPPYTLDEANTVYVVTHDIVADRNAFNITANNITLDLGGHTVIHANALIPDLDYEKASKSGSGIRMYTGREQKGLRILNGIIRQGDAENNRQYYPAKRMVHPSETRKKVLGHNMAKGLNTIELFNCTGVEIAGITGEYRLPQTWCMRFTGAGGKYDIHHNICLDKGTIMFSRHGDGECRSIGFRGADGKDVAHQPNDFSIHHNLIKRTRQNGINMAQQMFANEIYVDSWVVNSFALSPLQEGARVHDNLIFLTGYYGCGILWATRNLEVWDNFIHMESIITMVEKPDSGRRLIETWGEQDVLAGFRLTNYDHGGQERENLLYHDNVIFGRCRRGAEMRGTEFYSDYSIKNLQCNNNTIRILGQDTLTFKAACVDAQGAYNDRTKHLPVYYRNDSLVSNICNVRFGDDYGQGSNHQFIQCTLVKTGSNPNYHTFLFDGHSSVFNHGFLDCEFSGGASPADVYWSDTQSLSNYHISWTLTIDSSPSASVTIRDKNGKVVVKDHTGPNGMLSVPLMQMIIRPLEWQRNGEEVEVIRKSKHQEETFSPYSVTVSLDGSEKTEKVIMDQQKTVRIIP